MMAIDGGLLIWWVAPVTSLADHAGGTRMKVLRGKEGEFRNRMQVLQESLKGKDDVEA